MQSQVEAPAIAAPAEVRPPAASRAARSAVIALLIATVFWGCGFTWAKAGGENVNTLAGLPHGAPLGPIWLLCVRFAMAGFVWLAVFPAARRGWTLKSVGRAFVAGGFLAGGLITQHLGLDRSSEAVTAFLTSLTILFVPLLMTVVLRRPPPAVLWLGVALAIVGVWLMTGASPTGFGLGEVLGMACAVIFSMHLISVNLVVEHDDPARMAPGQFLAVALITGVVCLFLGKGPQSLWPPRLVQLATASGVGMNLLWMVLLVTIGAFGLQTHFQQHLDPTRAALLYLCEPVFAAAYAWLAAGRTLGAVAAAGAGLILAANVLVELLQARWRRSADAPPALDAGAGAAVID
jgi:drug/metabolite transporter (DMT)-like permease